jgi:hypothetical protein
MAPASGDAGRHGGNRPGDVCTSTDRPCQCGHRDHFALEAGVFVALGRPRAHAGLLIGSVQIKEARSTACEAVTTEWSATPGSGSAQGEIVKP